MSTTGLCTRLRRIEHTHAARDPAGIPRPAVLYLAPGEDAAPHLAALADRGEHRHGWPAFAIRADWPATRAPESFAP